MSPCCTTEFGCGFCPPLNAPFFTVMPAAQHGPVISSVPIFPADPTLIAKPGIIRNPALAKTVTGPLKETATPEAPRRTTLPNVLSEVVGFKNVNVPVALVPGIEPVDCTVFD